MADGEPFLNTVSKCKKAKALLFGIAEPLPKST